MDKLGAVCASTEVIKKYIQSLSEQKKSLLETAQIYAGLKDAALSIGSISSIVAMGIPPAVAEFVLGEYAGNVWNNLQQRRDIIESVLNMIKNANTEFYLALLYLVSLRMIDDLQKFIDDLSELSQYVETIEVTARQLSTILKNISSENVHDIEEAKKHLENARRNVIVAKSFVEKSGTIPYHNILSAEGNVKNATMIMAQRYDDIGRFTKDGFVLSPKIKQLFTNFSSMATSIDSIMRTITRIRGTYEVLKIYQSLILTFPETLEANNAAAQMGLYAKNLDISRDSIDSIIDDMREFLSGSRSKFYVQYKRGKYISSTLALYRWMQMAFGSMRTALAELRRSSSYERIRTLLSESSLFNDFEDVMTMLHLRMATFLGRFSTLMAFDYRKTIKFVNEISAIRKKIDRAINDATTLKGELSNFNRIESKQLNTVIELLRMLGVKDPIMFLAGGDVVGLTKEIVGFVASAASFVKCIGLAINIDNKAKEFVAGLVKDRDDSTRYIQSIEGQENIYASLDWAERWAKKEVEKIDQEIETINRTFQ